MDALVLVLASIFPVLVLLSSFSRDVRWLRIRSARPEPFKYIHFPPRVELGLQIEVTDAGGSSASVTLSTKQPIKGIILDVDGAEDVRWSDQAIDLVPDDPQTVTVKGLRARTVHVRFLGDGSA